MFSSSVPEFTCFCHQWVWVKRRYVTLFSALYKIMIRRFGSYHFDSKLFVENFFFFLREFVQSLVFNLNLIKSGSRVFQVNQPAMLYSNAILSNGLNSLDLSNGWREKSFLSLDYSPRTDVTGSLNSGSLAEDKRKDCNALASSTLIALLFDQLQKHFNHQVQRLHAETHRLIITDTLQDSYTAQNRQCRSEVKTEVQEMYCRIVQETWTSYHGNMTHRFVFLPNQKLNGM